MKKAILFAATLLSLSTYAHAQIPLFQIKKAPFSEYMTQASYQKATVTQDGQLIVQLANGSSVRLKLAGDTFRALQANAAILEKAQIETYTSEIVCMMMPSAPRSHLFVGERLRAVYSSGGCEYSFKLHPADEATTALAAAVVQKIDALVSDVTSR